MSDQLFELARYVLIYVVLEWALIVLLVVDGFLAFISHVFASFFKLRTPCLLCTRIDHVLLGREADFYYNESMCETHQKEVSSLAYCHVHKRLSDVRKMCEDCLLSFATEKRPDGETPASVAILHEHAGLNAEDGAHECCQEMLLSDGKFDEAKSTTGPCCCSCCSRPLKSKPAGGRNMAVASQAPAPSPRAPFVTLRHELHALDSPSIPLHGDEEDRFTASSLLHIECEPKSVDDGLKVAESTLLTGMDSIAGRGVNKIFGIPLTDSAAASPRWLTSNPRWAATSPRCSTASPRVAAKLRPKSLLEKREHPSEGGVSAEVEGDSVLHHLKRQVHLDRKSMLTLCLELDEERSASAVAANNAMAMITRLQAEKAAVQMEALQYQRMMEEQAEYDQDALRESNYLLAKREEEIKILEAQLQAYRDKYGDLREEEGEERRVPLGCFP